MLVGARRAPETMPAEQPETRLRTRWDALARRIGLAHGGGTALLDELMRAYAQSGRHYHNLDHIAALLELLDRHGDSVRNRDALELAILFHDAVYLPARADNEAASAALARERLTHLGVSEEMIGEVERLILATRHGAPSAGADSDPDLALLLDLDLSILGADRATYAAYAEAIRREYAIVPDAIYRPGRRRVLTEFLARPRIYATPHLHDLWEPAARANLEWECAALAR
jgi:predicted metal-dependent HD superfamily phosphohydrolase